MSYYHTQRPIMPKIPKNKTVQEWKDFAEHYRPGSREPNLRELKEDVDKYASDIPAMFLGKTDGEDEKYRINPIVPLAQLAKHHAAYLGSPNGTHAALLRQEPSGVLKVWDPHGIPITDPKSLFYTVRDEIMNFNPKFELQKPTNLQNNRGVCSLHTLDRFCHTDDTDEEYNNKTLAALMQTQLPYTGINPDQFLDLAKISQAVDIVTGFEMDREMTEADRDTYNASYIGEGKKDRRGFRR
jgi:hypothetical protein